MAEKKGSKQGSPDDIMAAAEIKAVLVFAKRGDPAACAIALTKDKDGVLLLDKKRKPKAVLADLKKKAAAAGLELEAPTMRFGRAVVDTDADATLLTLVVNKDAPSAMRPKLLERVKKAGFHKVEIGVDAALEMEEEAAPAAPGVPPAAEQSATAAPQPSPATPEAPPEPAAPPADLSGLTQRLTGLVKQLVPIFQADPQRGATLRGLAEAAQAAIKAGEAVAAAKAVDALEHAIGAAGAPTSATATSPPAGAAPPETIAKARQAWVATRQKIESDLAKLHASFHGAFDGHPQKGDISKAFTARVETVLGTLNEELAHTLEAVNAAKDPAERARLVDQAHAQIEKFSQHVASDQTIAMLDKNPFVPMAVGKTMTATLAALSKSIC